jgi:hypothetical protein
MNHNLVLSGGLGNQMFQYIAARELLGDKFTLNSGYLPTSLSAQGFPEICDLNLIDTIKIDVSKKPYAQRKIMSLILKLSSVWISKTWKQKIAILMRPLLFKILSITFFRGYQLITGKGIGWSELDVSNGKPIILIGNFQSYIWVENSLQKYKDELNLKLSSKIVADYGKLSELEKPLIVHVRLGDFLEIPELNVINKQYFKSAINESMEANTSKKVWLFTNNSDFIGNYISDLEDPKYRLFSLEFLTSAETLQVMKLGSGYILSNSTYGWWAAFLRKNDQAKVVVPANWYSTLPIPYKLIPDNWLKVNNRPDRCKK